MRWHSPLSDDFYCRHHPAMRSMKDTTVFFLAYLYISLHHDVGSVYFCIGKVYLVNWMGPTACIRDFWSWAPQWSWFGLWLFVSRMDGMAASGSYLHRRRGIENIKQNIELQGCGTKIGLQSAAMKFVPSTALTAMPGCSSQPILIFFSSFLQLLSSNLVQ
ncbi:hypothetical protein BDW72DRAFT_129130 [Aspergillus terricola var. indicus]